MAACRNRSLLIGWMNVPPPSAITVEDGRGCSIGVASRFRFRGTAARPATKNFANEQLFSGLDFLVKVEEFPVQQTRQRAADIGLARAHEAGERDDGSGFAADGRRLSAHCD